MTPAMVDEDEAEDEDGRAKNEQAQLVSRRGTLCCL